MIIPFHIYGQKADGIEQGSKYNLASFCRVEGVGSSLHLTTVTSDCALCLSVSLSQSMSECDSKHEFP